jgi:hypothetical protein
LVEASEALDSQDNEMLNDAQDIARQVMTRQTLLRVEGWFSTYEGDLRPIGQQKHPVQLNPIAYLPMPEMTLPGSPCAIAWQNRFELTLDAKRPNTCGWTLGEFALASVRMRAPEEFEKDLLAIQPCRSADPRWIQFYESSFQEGWHLSKAYYFPMSGLYLQAFTDCLVQDWRGFIDVFACLLPCWRDRGISFSGLRARGDVILSGSWNAGMVQLLIVPGKRSPPKIQIMISQPCAHLRISGHDSGPDHIAGGEVVELGIGSEPIIILGK